jgi:enoyl-CoA hydratase
MTKSIILRERPAEGVARLTLNRPEARNAQNLALLYELDDAFAEAMADEGVRVVILAAAGKDFSAGHDLREPLNTIAGTQFRSAASNSAVHSTGTLGYMAREQEVYLGLCQKWRDLPKPTIAQVQGRCIAAGLMLAWVCDLIIAADDALFLDPVVAMGVNGVEWFAHPWELGPRKAKEMLFTGDALTAEEALQRGMVNHVVVRTELERFTLSLATRIAAKPAAALAAAKKTVNETLDIQGQRTALEMAFKLHHLCHFHNMEVHGALADPAGMPRITPGGKHS